MLANAVQALDAEYLSMFVQRAPKYAIKQPGKTWKTKQKSLADPAIKAHLRGQYAVAAVAPWYPSFGVIDIDDASREKVDYVLESVGLDCYNCFVCASESPNSYHAYFRPSYKGKPPTIRLLNDVFKHWAIKRNVEIYPKAEKCFRLPFGPHDRPILESGEFAEMTLREKMYWFGKIDEYDLAESPAERQTLLDFQIEPLPVSSQTYQRGLTYLEYGLEASGTRHEAQFCVLYAMWRMNYNVQDAIVACFQWIQKKNNGFSKDIKRNPYRVQREIMRQAERVWNDYELAKIYPDVAHNIEYGYLTKPDLLDIIRITEGNLPRMKFLGELVRYINPRSARGAVNVHRDKLISWSGHRTYLKYIDEFSQKGILERSDNYIVGKAAKAITLKWDFRSHQDAIKADKRTTDTIGSIVNSFAPMEFRECLQAAGTKRTTSIMATKNIFDQPNTGNILPFIL